MKFLSVYTFNFLFKVVSGDILSCKLHSFIVNLCCQEPPAIQTSAQQGVDARSTCTYTGGKQTIKLIITHS